jgi:Holliday junction resolvasome RuvABC DNA-binding subunit
MVGRKLAINLMMELSKELRILLGEYHLTPSTRAAKSRSSDAVDEADDPVAAFLGKPQLVK